MKDEEKLDVFREYLDLVQTPQINEFTQFILLRLPEYFWTLPASTTGKNHGADETLQTGGAKISAGHAVVCHHRPARHRQDHGIAPVGATFPD